MLLLPIEAESKIAQRFRHRENLIKRLSETFIDMIERPGYAKYTLDRALLTVWQEKGVQHSLDFIDVLRDMLDIEEHKLGEKAMKQGILVERAFARIPEKS